MRLKYAAEIDGFFDESATFVVTNNCFEYVTEISRGETLSSTMDFRLYYKMCIDKHEDVWSEWRLMDNSEAIV